MTDYCERFLDEWVPNVLNNKENGILLILLTLTSLYRWPKIKNCCHIMIPMCLLIVYSNVVMMNAQNHQVAIFIYHFLTMFFAFYIVNISCLNAVFYISFITLNDKHDETFNIHIWF